VKLAYRITKARYARQAFSGEGARLAGGRWNLPGGVMVYTSSSLALAAMETFVHLGEEGLALRLVYFRIEIPDEIAIERCARPPSHWRQEPPAMPSMRYGSNWLRRGGSAVLEVPSAIVPIETNYLLNPQHSDFAKIQIGRPTPFAFDSRMWK
jgi:RES domain-containing protein